MTADEISAAVSSRHGSWRAAVPSNSRTNRSKPLAVDARARVTFARTLAPPLAWVQAKAGRPAVDIPSAAGLGAAEVAAGAAGGGVGEPSAAGLPVATGPQAARLRMVSRKRAAFRIR